MEDTHALDIVEPNYEKIVSYADYLDHFVTSKDLFYLESDEVSRTIVTLGYRVPELLSRENLDLILEQIKEGKLERKQDETFLAKNIPTEELVDPLMRALAEREQLNRTGYESCILFIRDVNKKGHEVSGYIDFKARLAQEPEKWRDYYTSKIKLLPTRSDLSYYNWTTFFSTCQIISIP